MEVIGEDENDNGEDGSVTDGDKGDKRMIWVVKIIQGEKKVNEGQST